MKIRLPSGMKFNYLLQSFIFNQAYVISQGVPWISKRPEFENVQCRLWGKAQEAGASGATIYYILMGAKTM